MRLLEAQNKVYIVHFESAVRLSYAQRYHNLAREHFVFVRRVGIRAVAVVGNLTAVFGLSYILNRKFEAVGKHDTALRVLSVRRVVFAQIDCEIASVRNNVGLHRFDIVDIVPYLYSSARLVNGRYGNEHRIIGIRILAAQTRRT